MLPVSQSLRRHYPGQVRRVEGSSALLSARHHRAPRAHFVLAVYRAGRGGVKPDHLRTWTTVNGTPVDEPHPTGSRGGRKFQSSPKPTRPKLDLVDSGDLAIVDRGELRRTCEHGRTG